VTAAARASSTTSTAPRAPRTRRAMGKALRPPDRSRSPGAPASSPPPERGERDMPATSTPPTAPPPRAQPPRRASKKNPP
jgi:hypothetical protein